MAYSYTLRDLEVIAKNFIMKNFIMKSWSILMVIAILTVSCTKDYMGNKPPLYNAPDYSQNEAFLEEYMAVAANHVAENGANFMALVEKLNQYSVKKTGKKIFDIAEAEALQSQLEKYRFGSNDGSLKTLFQILESEGKLSQGEVTELIALDKQMNQEMSISDGISILESFEQNIIKNETLTTEEKDRLLFFKSTMTSSYMALNNSEFLKTQSCIECILKKKWSIFGWSVAVALAGVALCAAVAFNPLCLLAVLAGWAIVIGIHCPQCFGIDTNTPEPCEDCPSPYNFDGANCYLTHFPSATQGFIYNNAFYYTPRVTGTQCPHQPFAESQFDGANCLVKWGIPSNSAPFIWNNGFYIQPICK